MSQPDPVNIPAGNNEPTLDDLARRLAAAKSHEAAAKGDRIDAEEQLLELGNVKRHAAENGSATTKGAEFSVTVKDEKKARFAEKSDDNMSNLFTICQSLDIAVDDMPVKTTYALDYKKLQAIKEASPEAYAKIVELAGIEIYPAKPSVSVKAVS